MVFLFVILLGILFVWVKSCLIVIVLFWLLYFILKWGICLDMVLFKFNWFFWVNFKIVRFVKVFVLEVILYFVVGEVLIFLLIFW